jgi:peptidoglycan hydrolase-like protein with peptidoglycan-binding domain
MLWLPKAIRDEHHIRINSWTTRTRPKGVLHTTETAGWPDYRSWTVPPHVTILPIPGQGVGVRQHIPFSSGSFALRNETGGVQTNRAYAFQFELIGTCHEAGPGYHWPEADDAVLLGLWRSVIQPVSTAFGIPLTAPRFLPYLTSGTGGSYGLNNGVRLRGQAWVEFTGWCGHQHVDENVHGDPGDFKLQRLFQLGRADDPAADPDHTNPLPQPVTPPAPRFPLLPGWYFGPEDGPDYSVSGYHSHRDDLRRWQNRMRERGWTITADGLYGSETREVATKFQKEKHLPADGLIGVKTWDAAWTAPVT